MFVFYGFSTIVKMPITTTAERECAELVCTNLVKTPIHVHMCTYYMRVCVVTITIVGVRDSGDGGFRSSKRVLSERREYSSRFDDPRVIYIHSEEGGG